MLNQLLRQPLHTNTILISTIEIDKFLVMIHFQNREKNIGIDLTLQHFKEEGHIEFKVSYLHHSTSP